MKISLFLWMIILCSTIVYAEQICLNPVKANESCIMMTPSLVCDEYFYFMFDNDGNIIDSGNLSLFNTTIYYFDFMQDIGTYYIYICDGSTRQIIVEGDNMIGFTTDTWVLFLLIGMFILFLYLAFKLTPLFLVLNGIIFFYMGYTTYVEMKNLVILVMMSLVGLLFIFFGIIGEIHRK